ncbi:hypothetical protein PGT21_009332 [Puccinia graminis f. sp. tritici]|uniref:Uncharacterized protein n=1 Tax=Puccinia graminis f. sp. tritici TaxID=56615 RepID=A0A5B0NN20_PUCGR|nr:hypothetical protein PGT21_009332 [Puccinia graminis f. sp. tritici]KAA1090052.1 hypothetical protein PGTUg99_034731 [Puccinia graminis f. sp. tritici]
MDWILSQLQLAYPSSSPVGHRSTPGPWNYLLTYTRPKPQHLSSSAPTTHPYPSPSSIVTHTYSPLNHLDQPHHLTLITS